MADSNPTGGGSLADRISKPTETADPKPAASSSWADEVASPTEAKTATTGGLDGASEQQGGSRIEETEKAVSVTLNPESLAKMQADPNNPLYSADTFEKVIT